MLKILISMVSTSICSLLVGSDKLCHPGELLYTPRSGPDICIQCNGGYFMAESKHTSRKCHQCTRIHEPFVEVLVSECNITQDAVISCVDGYFRTSRGGPQGRGECLKCTECPFPKWPCQKDSDTVCCPGESYEVAQNEHGNLTCVKTCGRGQYLNVTTSTCLPCPFNRFMDSAKHSFLQCQKCAEPDDDLETIREPCTSSQQTLIICAHGYFRDRSPYSRHEGTCLTCRNCSENTQYRLYKARECGHFQNTVCCPRADMIVIDTPDGPNCQEPEEPNIMSGCGQGQFLPSVNASMTFSCTNGIFMVESKHLYKTCQDLNKEQAVHPGAGSNDHQTTYILVLVIVNVVLQTCCIVLIIVMMKLRLDYRKQVRYNYNTENKTTKSSFEMLKCT